MPQIIDTINLKFSQPMIDTLGLDFDAQTVSYSILFLAALYGLT